MDAGRGVEQRVIGAVVVIRRRVHEGTRHHRNLRKQRTKTRPSSLITGYSDVMLHDQDALIKIIWSLI